MYRIYVDDIEITDKVLADSISISKIYCDGQLSLSQVSSEQLKLTTTEDLNLTGKKLRLKWGEYFVVSDYTVTYSAKVQNSNTVNLTAYDDLKKFDKDVSDYYNSLAEPFTLKTLVEGLGSYVGVSISVPTWAANRTRPLHKTIAPSKLNGLDLMGKACELMGMWLSCWSGQTSWRRLIRNNGEIIRHTVGANAYKRKDYNTYPIKRVAIKTEEGDVGVVSGTGGSCYTVLGNYLIYGNNQLQGFADELLTELDGLSYRPCEIEIPITDFCLISAQYVYDDDYFLAMEKEMGKTIKVKCHGTEYLEEPESTAVDIEIIKGQSNVIKNDVNGLKQRVTTIEGDYMKESEITVISGEIKAEVKEEIKDDFVPVEGGTTTTAASWSLKPEGFSVSANGTEVLKVDADGLTVNGSGTVTGKINGVEIDNGTIESSDIYLQNGGIYIKHGDAGSEVTTTVAKAEGDGNDTYLSLGGTSDNDAIKHTDIYGTIETTVHASETTLTGDIAVEANARVYGNLEVDGTARFDGGVVNDLDVTQQLFVKAAGGEKVRVNGDSVNAYTANGEYGDLHLQYGGGTVKVGYGGSESDLYVNGEIHTTDNIYGTDLSLMGDADISGNVSINGDISANDIEAGLVNATELSQMGEPINDLFASKGDAVSLEIDGYICPIINGIKNYVDDNTYHRKIARVDLGELSWTKGGSNRFISTQLVNKIKNPSNPSVVPKVLLQGYRTVDFSTIYYNEPNLSISITDNASSARGNINIVNKAYTDATKFKNAMRGAYLYYELATEQTEEYLNNDGLVNTVRLGELSGGRNLFSGYTDLRSYQKLTNVPSYAPTPIQFNDLVGTLSEWGGAYQGDLIMENGKTYTASAWVWVNGSNNQVYLYNGNTGYGFKTINSQTWTRVSFTFTGKGEFVSWATIGASETLIGNVQIEEGSVAHDYEPYYMSNRQLTDSGDLSVTTTHEVKWAKYSRSNKSVTVQLVILAKSTVSAWQNIATFNELKPRRNNYFAIVNNGTLTSGYIDTEGIFKLPNTLTNGTEVYGTFTILL